MSELPRLLGRHGSEGQFGAQAPLQLLTQFRDFHSRHHDELAREHFARLIVVGKLACDAAILTILIPAKTAIRDCFRTDELEASQQRVPLRDLELLPHDVNVDKFFVRSEWFGHETLILCERCGERPRSSGSRAAELE